MFRVTSTALEPDEFYTVARAAKWLRVSPSTVWRWIEAQKLPAVRVGPKTIRIRKNDLDALVQPARATRKGKRLSAAVEQLKLEPPSKEEIARRKALVAEILALRDKLNIAPLTTADLIHRVREVEQESYGRPR